MADALTYGVRRKLYFLCPGCDADQFIVNMKDGDASQAKRCWSEESPGNILLALFTSFNI